MKWELPCKKMMILHSSSIPLLMDGQALSEKCQVIFKHIGPSEKSWPLRWYYHEGAWIVVWDKKHEATLKLINEGDLGLDKCKLRAKDTVYWPGLSNQLEKLILNCEMCLKYLYAKCKPKPTTSLGQEIPVHPWFKLATDIFHFEGAAYLLIVDYTSRFLIVCKLTSMTSIHVANQCKSVFSEYGWPDTLISDNGPWFLLQALTSVMQVYSVHHIPSSLHYPQSNGLAEKYVQLVKCFFNKAKGKENFLQVFDDLLQYPLTGSLQSPVQVLQGRSARSDFQMSSAARNQLGIQPKVLRNIDKHEKLPTHDLHVGQHFMCQDSVTKWWHQAIITRLCQEKHSNKIKTSDGVIYRKTQAHLKPYAPQSKTTQWKQSVTQPMAQSDQNQPMRQPMAQSDHKKPLPVNNWSQVPTSRPKRDTK